MRSAIDSNIAIYGFADFSDASKQELRVNFSNGSRLLTIA